MGRPSARIDWLVTLAAPAAALRLQDSALEERSGGARSDTLPIAPPTAPR